MIGSGQAECLPSSTFPAFFFDVSANRNRQAFDVPPGLYDDQPVYLNCFPGKAGDARWNVSTFPYFIGAPTSTPEKKRAPQTADPLNVRSTHAGK